MRAAAIAAILALALPLRADALSDLRLGKKSPGYRAADATF